MIRKMKRLTKQDAIQHHRKMWNWIANETERRKRKVWKSEYFEAMGISGSDIPDGMCYCCEFDRQQNKICGKCIACPIDWNSKVSKHMCTDKYGYDENGLFMLWFCSWNWKTAARLAREIAELPERGE